jgi:hypothetical protein
MIWHFATTRVPCTTRHKKYINKWHQDKENFITKNSWQNVKANNITLLQIPWIYYVIIFLHDLPPPKIKLQNVFKLKKKVSFLEAIGHFPSNFLTTTGTRKNVSQPKKKKGYNQGMNYIIVDYRGELLFDPQTSSFPCPSTPCMRGWWNLGLISCNNTPILSPMWNNNTCNMIKWKGKGK